MTLGQYLSRYMEVNGLTYREFAKQCKGVSFQYIQMLVKGVNPGTGRPITPGITKLNSIARAMNMTLHELLESVDDLNVDISPIGSSPRQPDSISNVDYDRLEALHQNPRLRLLFDRQRKMSDADVEAMLAIADRIVKEDNEN